MTASTSHKQATIQICKADVAGFDARFIMSAGSVDRVGDTIDPDAYDKAAAKHEKLIALFNHDPDKIAGFWTDLKRKGDTLTGLIKFASTGLGQMLKTLVDDGVPLGASIGFRGSGEPNKQGGIHFKVVDLMETSIVSVPAHPRAMQIAKSFGITLDSDEQAKSRRVQDAVTTARRVIAQANLSARARK